MKSLTLNEKCELTTNARDHREVSRFAQGDVYTFLDKWETKYCDIVYTITRRCDEDGLIFCYLYKKAKAAQAAFEGMKA